MSPMFFATFSWYEKYVCYFLVLAMGHASQCSGFMVGVAPGSAQRTCSAGEFNLELQYVEHMRQPIELSP